MASAGGAVGGADLGDRGCCFDPSRDLRAACCRPRRAQWSGSQPVAFVSVLVALTLALAWGGPASGAVVGKFQRALALEQQGRFKEAAALLASARRLGPGKREHATALNQALKALDAAEIYRGGDQLEQAEMTLKSAMDKLDRVRDPYIFLKVSKRLAALTKTEHAEADKEARAGLKRAAELESDEHYDDAAEAYGAVASATDVSPSLVNEARVGKRRAQREDATAEDDQSVGEEVGGWFADRGHDVADWAVTLLPLVLALVAFAILLRIPYWRRPEGGKTQIKMTDWGAERTERKQKSLALGQQFKAEIDAAAAAGASGAEVDETKDLDGSVVPGLSPAGDEISGIDDVIPEDSSIKIGPVAFNLAQLLNVFRTPFRRRPARELVGSLTTQTDRAIIAAELITADDQRPKPRWLVKAEGTSARADVLAELAIQVAVDLGQSYVSGNWRSVRNYRKAVETLNWRSNDKAEERLVEARRLLQLALEDDQHNLLARFYLATVERALGRNMLAVKHLDFLETLLNEDFVGRNGRKAFLGQHPEFPHLVAYNKAVALAKIDDWNCHKRAMAILADLWTSVSKGDGQDSADAAVERRRLLALVRSTEASARVFELEEWRALPSDQQLDKHRRETLEQIRKARSGLAGSRTDTSVRESNTYLQARANAENAYGRALDIMNGNVEEAVAALDTAVSLAPQFTDAWLNLASILIKHEYGADWASRAQDALERALELAPKSPKAHYLRGELCEKQARDEEAVKEFTQVEGDYRAAMKLAQLAGGKEDFKTAAEQMARSLKLRDDPDFRAILYVEYLLKHPDEDPSVLDEAETWAKKLATKGVTAGNRRRGQELLEEIEDLRPAE
jgi:tetratricopeptide (TPR) repeat protein